MIGKLMSGHPLLPTRLLTRQAAFQTRRNKDRIVQRLIHGRAVHGIEAGFIAMSPNSVQRLPLRPLQERPRVLRPWVRADLVRPGRVERRSLDGVAGGIGLTGEVDSASRGGK